MSDPQEQAGQPPFVDKETPPPGAEPVEGQAVDLDGDGVADTQVVDNEPFGFDEDE